MTATPRRRFPYTLLELVIAAAIFAMLMISAGLGMASVYRSWDTAGRHKARLLEYQALDRVFNLAFRNAVPFTWTDAESGEARPVFVGNPQSVLLAYRSRIAPDHGSGLRFLSLFVENGALKAVYRNTPILPWDMNVSGAGEEILAEGVESVSFLYAGSTDEGALTWTPDWPEDEDPPLPLAIQITVLWRDGRSECWLRRTAGNGFRERDGFQPEVVAP